MKIKHYLEKSLFGFLKTKSIDDIYVIEVINDIGTCKGTFYKYYRDKYDLLCYCFKDFIYKDIPETSENWQDLIMRLLAQFEANASVVLNSFTSVDVNSVRHENERILSDFISRERTKKGLSTEGKAYAYALNMYAVYCTDIIIDWLKEGAKKPKSEVYEMMRTMIPVALIV